MTVISRLTVGRCRSDRLVFEELTVFAQPFEGCPAIRSSKRRKQHEYFTGRAVLIIMFVMRPVAVRKGNIGRNEEDVPGPAMINVVVQLNGHLPAEYEIQTRNARRL